MQLEDYVRTYRGVYHSCPECNGTGVKMYGNTTTWRKGIGGAAMTNGVCDRCWGSGDADRPWYSHRTYEEMVERLRIYNATNA